MTYEEAKAYIDSVANKGNNLTDEEKEKVNAIHKQVFYEGVETCNCVNIYSDAIIRLRIWFKNNTAFRSCNYYMQAGAAFMIGGLAYTNYNLTDEAAEYLLEHNESAKALIHKIEKAEAPAEKAEVKKVSTKKAKK